MNQKLPAIASAIKEKVNLFKVLRMSAYAHTARARMITIDHACDQTYSVCVKRSNGLGRTELTTDKASRTVKTAQTVPDYVPRVPDRPMTPKELAAFLKVSPATIRRMFRKKELPYVRVGQRVRFLPGQVLRALQGNGK